LENTRLKAQTFSFFFFMFYFFSFVFFFVFFYIPPPAKAIIARIAETSFAYFESLAISAVIVI
jgi:hypothetical protein